MNIKLDPILRRMREVDDPSTGFPTTADDGDIMMFQRGEDRGNTTSCKFLLQPSQSGNSLVDSAAGNETPVVITNAGLTIDEAGDVAYGSGSYAYIAGGLLPIDVLVANHDWVVDLSVKITDPGEGGNHAFFGTNNNHSTVIGINGDSKNLYFRDDAGTITTPYTLGSNALLTWEYFYDEANSQWKQACYLAGQLLGIKGNATLNDECTRLAPYYIGTVQPYASNSGGLFHAVRIRNVAPYRGVSFVPQALPWLPPGPGSWQKTSLATLKAKLEALA